MPSPSPEKFRGPIVRQLSLQNPAPVSRGLKKQLSEDDGKTFEPVEVTGQGWNVSTQRIEHRIHSGNGKISQTKSAATRPKPVKVAWADRKSPECPVGVLQDEVLSTKYASVDERESVLGVEVIATKCQGQPRPSSLKTQRLRSPLLGNKDTLVYTRLQLAERLRNAWSEREKIKPNINIFLAGAPDTTRSDNETPNAVATFADTASALSDPSAPLDKKRKSMRVRAFSQDIIQPEAFEQPESFIVPEPGASINGSEEDLKDSDNEKNRPLQELNKIEIRMTKIEKVGEGRENKPPEDSENVSTGAKRSRNKTLESEGKPEAEERQPTSAQDRRANFRRSSLLNKTITDSFDEIDGKPATKPALKKPTLTRAFSAPSQNDQTDVQKTANVQRKVKIMPFKRLQPSVSFDIPSTNDDVAAQRDRIKSAPVRRRLKSAAARRKSKDKDSSDEEKEVKESGNASKKQSKRNQLKKNGEIVTMVSLVSPAESDADDSVINLPIESWRSNEKGDETPQSGKSAAEEFKDSSFVLQKFVTLRKTTKSVTFQQHPVLSRSYSASFPSRRAPAGTPIVVPTPVVNNPALTPAQLLERDRRNLAFGSGTDGRGIKRKLLRTSTESAKEEENFEANEKPYEKLNSKPKERNEEDDEEDEEGEKRNGEPEFKCQKERECWNLYKKMLDKGVSVSFDTVLRGMLTPTEYRLRKNQLLANF